MDGAPSTFVGGTEAGARNVISGNQGVGLTVSGGGASNNIIQGNFIGTDVSGTVALSNFGGGLLILGGPNNTVGGVSTGARNVISGNKLNGVTIEGAGATKNTVQGNFIGTDVSGTIAVANNNHGVYLSDAIDNTVGGTAAGAGNLISGNGGSGIFINTEAGTSTGNKLQGNFIGTNVSGMSALGNGSNGVLIQFASSNNLIGGTEAGARNVISANGDDGVFVVFTGSGNLVQGNFIGTDLTGNAALGNTNRGVAIVRSPNVTVGGSTAGAGNVISGNGAGGIFISGPETSGDQVQGNHIGTGANTTTAIGNKGNGVFLSETSNTSVDSGNVIAFNRGTGVFLQGIFPVAGNAILSNSIYSNGQLGIDLNTDGVTANDPSDADTGPNNLQNYPVITSARTNPSNGTTVLQVTLNSTPNTLFNVQYFSSAAANPSGYGEGQTYRGFDLVKTDGSGNVSYSTILSGLTAYGQVFTATATDPNHNTRSFRRPLQWTPSTSAGTSPTVKTTRESRA
jgi:titin